MVNRMTPRTCHPGRPDPRNCETCRASAVVRDGSTRPPIVGYVASTTTPLPVLRSPCVHEGAVLEFCPTCQGDLRHVRDCDVHERCTRGFVSTLIKSCINCPEYRVAQYTTPNPALSVDGAGVVIGCYGLPKLAAIQVRMIRETCGDVPILIADDGSNRDNEFDQIVEQHPGVEFWPSDARLGHYAGDLSVVWKGLQFAHNRGVKWLCKLSQRFIWTETDWLRRAVDELSASGRATKMQRCMDAGPGNGGRPVDLKIRSESMLMDVAKWVPHFRDMERTILHNPTEFYFWGVIHREWGGTFDVWRELTADRYAKSPGTVWHGSHIPADYQKLATRVGLPLDPEFTTAGWPTLPGWKRG